MRTHSTPGTAARADSLPFVEATDSVALAVGVHTLLIKGLALYGVAYFPYSLNASLHNRS